MVHITWQQNLNLDLYDETNSDVIMKYHFYIFNDKSHDNYFMQHSLLLHWQSVLDGGCFHLNNHWIWSNGCSSQFKKKTPWFFVTRYPHLTGGCNMMWNFFGIGHGKGPHDGARAILKRFLKKS